MCPCSKAIIPRFLRNRIRLEEEVAVLLAKQKKLWALLVVVSALDLVQLVSALHLEQIVNALNLEQVVSALDLEHGVSALDLV
ncbi:Hypothetical predicted protein [Prunus dulcis]|uniref:Uncharacterized protein n=1 Tax=Prunus dulcis TaxID=3755 RepID=A0A5E4EV67_PRUDU|nr:Hypothetical predicted protein [Prunus dulcis]